MIWTGLGRHRDEGLLILRIGVGLAFVAHGWPKLVAGTAMWQGVGSAMGNLGIHFLPTFWGFIAAMAETLGGLLFAAGFLFRPTCAALTFQMFVALLSHLNHPDPGMRTFGAYSHALEAGFVFLAMLFIGPGRYSADRK